MQTIERTEGRHEMLGKPKITAHLEGWYESVEVPFGGGLHVAPRKYAA